MAFDVQGESSGQLDAQLDLFLQQIMEQEDLSGNALDVSTARFTHESWPYISQEPSLSMLEMPTVAAAPSVPGLRAASRAAEPAASAAYSQTQPQPLHSQLAAAHSQMQPPNPSLQHVADSIEAHIPVLPPPTLPYSVIPVHLQAQAAAAPDAQLAYSQVLSHASRQTAVPHETQRLFQQPPQWEAAIQPSVMPNSSSSRGTATHTATHTATGGAHKRSQAWSEKNRRAQQRFRERQKVCMLCSHTCDQFLTTSRRRQTASGHSCP